MIIDASGRGRDIDLAKCKIVNDPIDMLPDDERRLILAWRQARVECRNGRAIVTAAEVDGKMRLWIGHGAGNVLLR